MAALDPQVQAPLDPVGSRPIVQAPVPVPEPVTFRRIDDIHALRQGVDQQVMKAIGTKFPLENATHRLEVSDLQFENYNPSLADEKRALMERGRIAKKLSGSVRLIDKATGKVLDEKKTVLAHVPVFTRDGTLIHDGTSYSLRNQMRLRPGVYARSRADGGVEAQFNVRPGTGAGFRLELDQGDGRFRMKVGGSTTKLYPLLRNLGIGDDAIKAAWGEELWKKNFEAKPAEHLQDLEKIARKIGRRDAVYTPDLLPQAVKDIFTRAELDPLTTKLTLGEEHKNVSPELLLKATSNILRVARGEHPGDNRDSQAFQSFMAPDDLLAERIKLDPEGGARNLLWKASKTGKLKDLHPGLFSRSLQSIYKGSGLAQAAEETNMLELADLKLAVTRMGEGGISSEQAVSREARGVQPSYFGIIDPVRAPESGRAGLDLRMTANVLKGSDGQLYGQYRNMKTGKLEPVPSSKLDSLTLAFPGEMAKPGRMVRGIRNGQMEYVPKTEVQYELPEGGDMFGTVTRMVPMLEGVKGQRLLMGARMSVTGDTVVLVLRATGEVFFDAIEHYVRQDGDLAISISKRTNQLEWMPVRAAIKHLNVKRIREVKLHSGRKIKATDDHSFVTLDDTGHLVKVHTQDLVEGCPIPVAAELPAFPLETVNAWKVDAGEKHNAHPGCTLELDYDLGWIHGLYASEGSVSYNGRKTPYIASTQFANCDVDVLARVEAFFARVGVSATSSDGVAGGKLDRVIVGWRKFSEKIADEFGEGAYHKKLPAWVFAAPKAYRQGLLAGYITGDGGVSFRREGQLRVNGSSRSLRLIEGLSHICATLGILTVQQSTNVMTGPGGTAAVQHYFEVRAEHIHKLPTLGCARKDERIAKHTWSGKKSGDWLPMFENLRQAIAKRTKRGTQDRQRMYLNQHTRQTVTSILGDHPATAGWLTSGVVWDRVESVTEKDAADYEYVYDLDMGDNVFMCGNGVFVHNTTQALPLRDQEAPLVRSADTDGVDLHRKLGASLGAIRSDTSGTVVAVTPDYIDIQTPTGLKRHDLYNNYPNARKTGRHSLAKVQVGDQVQPDQLLAASNYTDKDGLAANGKNFRIAYMLGHRGPSSTYEDSFLVSESAAKRLESEHYYHQTFEKDENTKSTKKADYIPMYGGKYTKDQLSRIQDDGVIKVGSIVNYGDPLVLGIGRKKSQLVGALMNGKDAVTDLAMAWDHHAPGEVTDVVPTKDGGVKVLVKSYNMSDVADKLSGRFGNKGVIGEVVPDDQMPRDSEGRPLEVIQNAVGIISRVNPSAIIESLLGKVAEKRGQPYILKPFGVGKPLADFALEEAAKHGVSETEDLFDPVSGKTIKGIMTGRSYLMKLHHTAESKHSGRDTGSYTQEGTPAKGGEEGAKMLGLLAQFSLLSRGATEFMKDAKLVRGQKNDDFWRAFKQGETPTMPDRNFANDRFLDLLRAAGVNVRQEGTKKSLRPMLDADVDHLAQHEIDNSQTFDFRTMKPIAGGLFDLQKTGGADGTRWGKIVLPHKIPHPLFEQPIQRLLNLTGPKFRDVLAGKETINGKTGPEAIEHELSQVDLEREMTTLKQAVAVGKGSKRDQAVKALGYLQGLKTMGLKPVDLMISKIPVLPPKHRPIIRMPSADMPHDANYLYHDLLEARDNVRSHTQEFGKPGESSLTLYDAAKSVTGLTQPTNPKHVEQGVKGMLGLALGVGDTPKYASFIRKVIGNSVDTVGRGTITSGADMDMDELEMPTDMAIKIFRPFVIRRLVRMGMPAAEAVKAVKDKAAVAIKFLDEEMKARPVVYDRAPALHRAAFQGGFAHRGNHHGIRLPNVVLKGLGADHDGDAMNFHAVVGDKAVQEVKDKFLPSKSLLAPGTFESHYEPDMDYVAGLYLGTRPDSSQKERVFLTASQAKAAYKAGEISARTPIRIIENQK